MPPFIPKKRLVSTPPLSPKPTPLKKARLVDALDAESRNAPRLAKAETFSLGSDNSDSSLSDVDSDQFEDVPSRVKQPTAHIPDDEDEDEDIEWEDAGGQQLDPIPAQKPLASGDLQLIFRKDDEVIDYGTSAAATAGKKGPTKREKEVRIRTHQMHVQFLLWHNSSRNRWVCDKTVQQTLVEQLPPQIKKEVEKWRRASGLPDVDVQVKPTPTKSKKAGKQKAKVGRDGRDWSNPKHRLDSGKADLSRGDPLISLLKVLSAYWKKRFAITAPGLRKRGYGTKQGLKQDIASFRTEEHDPEKHGERIRNINEFREVAKKCEGSRDVGAQLFTALLRGLGIESRLVASLQPSGYGWTKAEQMVPRKLAKATVEEDSSDDSDSPDDTPAPVPKVAPMKAAKKSHAKKKRPARASKGNKDTPIDLDSDKGSGTDIKDDESVVDVTPYMPKQRAARYDRDVPFPVYWTEAVSPITHQTLPVSPLVLTTPVGLTPETLSAFEPRGAKAEKAKIVMAYVVAYASDGTAKDVTVRYLKKRIWPGKTKGFRFPIEKIPIYDKRGKVKRYEEYDWFKHVMSGYVRTHAMRTAVDDVEDSTDLVPQLPEKKETKDEGDTLQSLKASADFVLERFLRREEALRPGSKPDRMFTSGKGDGMKEEPVYRRADVERCLTAESWHKEGRKPKVGEKPMKLVPVRAVTLTRKREAEEHHRVTGEKQMQGLYSWDQTEFIIPPPIENGIIPKNSYGNIDCFVPSMVPRGAVHIPLRGTVRICKKLNIDFAEAVTGFEFGNKRAVPVCTGVVVAAEHAQTLKDAWKAWNEEQRKKEETKMEKLVLDLWRKFLMGLRIRERVEEAYGEELGNDGPTDLRRGLTKDEPIDIDGDDAASTTAPLRDDEDDMGGGFLLPHDDDILEPEDLVIVQHEPDPQPAQQRKGKESVTAQYPTPTSMSSKPPLRRQRKSLLQHSEEESEDSDLSSVPDDGEIEPQTEEDLSLLPSSSKRSSTRKVASIEVNIPLPKSTKRLGGKASNMDVLMSDASDSDHEADSTSSSSSPPSSSDEEQEDDEDGDGDAEEEEYIPGKSKQAARAAKKTDQKIQTPTRRSQRAKPEPNPQPSRTPKSTRSRRALRRDTTLVTSPYFKTSRQGAGEGSETGD